MAWSRPLPRLLASRGVMQLVALVDVLARSGIFSRIKTIF
jgi:hypothetical protein